MFILETCNLNVFVSYTAFMLMRECTKATTVNNIQFKEGDAVLIPSYSIHRNPEIYENPEQFDPERFQ